WLISSLRPDPGIEFHAGMVNGKRIAVLEIPAAVHNPVQFQKTEYIRIGSHKKSLVIISSRPNSFTEILTSHLSSTELQ
ncbi:helix-turn-helix domain-containing protein, partial [Mycolicibacterium llatzerense]|uniref:AlbA family DNA-binding domain-containing protein n=1 Tax=Mycolicibacterium llatzerense TaxID=280871 RepID=UPI0039B75FD6